MNIDLGGQRSFCKEFQHVVKEHEHKSLVKRTCVAFNLQVFQISGMTSEVKFDLGGQRSFVKKLNMCSTNMTKKV